MRNGNRPWDVLVSAVGSRYGALLVVLVSVVTVFPFFRDHSMVRWIVAVVSLALIATALRAISDGRNLLVAGWLMGLPAIVVSILARSFEIDWAYPLDAALRVVFFGFLIVVVLRDIWSREKIDMDALFGACCTYLLMGLAWGSAFALLEGLHPGSFDLNLVPPSTGPELSRLATESDLDYYSMITMTTVGYGDITPLSPPARTLAMLEGLLAQLYMAIIIARLVSLEIAQRLAGMAGKR